MHDKTIIIQTHDGTQISFTKVGGELKIQGQDMGFDADYLATDIPEDVLRFYDSRIACGYNPDVARFATLLHESLEAMEYNDAQDDPYEDLYMYDPENMSSWETIVYELWRSPSRLRNGDRFELNDDHIRCVTLNTTYTYTDSAEGIIQALLPQRTAH